MINNNIILNLQGKNEVTSQCLLEALVSESVLVLAVVSKHQS